ncbi:uncharacterized protein LOC127789601 [Diospyros lotus]|uniref:uncharacterized protein LOC127789601 n=1 Tax=Diospyros lotus TaxID=55363 RepID=UPI0022517022|nr:uncharacterized protein LOC127789601 [Diospyros lotus]
MDLEEWELLPDHGFLQIHDDGGRKIFSRKYGRPDPEIDFNMNYFICPSPTSQKVADSTEKVPVPIRLEQSSRVPIDPGPVEPDQDTVSQVFFKKMKENEFVDMKMDSPSPKSSIGSKMKIEKETLSSKKNKIDLPAEEAGGEEKGGGRNLWKWSMTGIGAICSFGVAAATICIIVLGSHRRNQQQCQQNQKLRFQIYADEKRIKEVVHRATKLNEAISAARGVPLTRAHITVGGHYDGL